MPTHYPIRDDDASVIDDPVDHIEPEEASDQYDDLAEALRVVLGWMLEAHNANTVGARCLVLARLLGIKHKHNTTYTRIADNAGCSRESVRQAARHMEAFAGLRTASVSTHSMRSNCAQGPLHMPKAKRYARGRAEGVREA